MHGRTRADKYEGEAEYDTIAAVKAAVRFPVIANGDIDSPQKARFVLDYTQADAVMIGRAAQGRPWIFREIAHYLATGETLPEPSAREVRDILLGHLQRSTRSTAKQHGVRIARKHLGWYAKDRPENAAFRAVVNASGNRARAAAPDARLFRRAGGRRRSGVRRSGVSLLVIPGRPKPNNSVRNEEQIPAG